MEITDRGYRFFTNHNPDPNGKVAHVTSSFRRFQKQAPIRRNQDFELDFYGKGAGIRLGASTQARFAVPATMAANRRASIASAIAEVSAASDTLAALAPPSTPSSSLGQPSVVVRTVQPEFHSPFDEQLFDWGLEQPPFPPFDPDGGGGGGGGGVLQAAVRIKLFIYGATVPIETWELPEEISDTVRFVEYEPEGFPGPDSPVKRTGWWRMVVTPIGPDPVEIYIEAQTRIGDVPIRTTPLTVRLTDHLFRVGLDALVPKAVVDGGTLYVSMGPEMAELLGRAPILFTKGISPGNSYAQLRSLDITAISGKKANDIAMKRYRERAARYVIQGNSTADLKFKLNYFFKSQLDRLALVQPDDVCIRIQAAFTDASLSVYGFDAASLDGDAGELILVFGHGVDRLLAFSFLDIKLTDLASIADALVFVLSLGVMELVPDVNKIIEDHLMEYDTAQSILTYMKAFLARAVGQNNFVFDFKLRNKAWQIRNSADPIIPLPRVTRPPVTGDPTEDGGIIGMLARADAALGADPNARTIENDIPATVSANTAPASDSEAASASSTLPPGFLTPGAHLNILDRHQCIVVIMMENRSYDHMLGDLMNARPGPKPVFPYDGAPNNATNPGVGGFKEVPLVHTRDLRLGTTIPVSPRHSFNAVQFQIGDGTEAGKGSGDMAGFARDLYHKSDSPQLAMTVYGEEELHVHYRLADEFKTCDRWFAAHPGPTFPNRFATIMGSIPELDNFENEDPRLGYLKHRNIFDALTAARIEWRVFESDLSLIRMFDKYRIDDRRVVPLYDKDDGLKATLEKPGPLPRVMFIEPNFADIPPIKTADDDHPPADLAHGQEFLSRMCNLLWDRRRFGEILLVITYDEHGGFFDHVPPPGTPKGEPGTYAPLIAGGPTHLGVRVPAFVVSPFIGKGRADRTIFDHTSILKTILVHNRDRFSTKELLSFGQRVNEAKDLSVLFDQENPRQAPAPFVLRARGKSDSFSNIHEELGSVPDVTPTSPTSTAVRISGGRSGDVIITERIVPPPTGRVEPRDYHAALAKMLKPRKRG